MRRRRGLLWPRLLSRTRASGLPVGTRRPLGRHSRERRLAWARSHRSVRRSWYRRAVTHEQALAAIRATLEAAPGPVSVAVVDSHGELVACIAMDGAARDTAENARRKAYTAARSDATSTRSLAEKVQGAATELASFDPQFSFFLGGVAAFFDDRRVGAVGVSGLPGAEDERLAIAAILAAGLDPPS